MTSWSFKDTFLPSFISYYMVQAGLKRETVWPPPGTTVLRLPDRATQILEALHPLMRPPSITRELLDPPSLGTSIITINVYSQVLLTVKVL